jgi:ADP-L-glycero-D-manno-heptose 6-epimerase
MAERYIVTGAAGFIGARVVEAARKRGADVISVDMKSGANGGGIDAFTTRPEHRGLDFGTTLDIDALEPFLAREFPNDKPTGITAVIHLGACSDTMELDESVHERLNVAYSKMLWSWCSKHGVPFVYASSAATYGDGASGYDDDESKFGSLEPLNPYGWSKLRFDLWALEREKAGEAPPSWAGFKFFNVYGFGERHKGRMASVILHSSDQIQKTGLVKLFKSHKAGYGDGEQKRDFVFVGDVVDVCMFAASGGIKRGIYNLGTGQARTFADLARATFKALGKAPNIEFIDMPEALRERYQYFTEAKMDRLRAAGYSKPFTSLEDGAARYVERLLAHSSGATAP